MSRWVLGLLAATLSLAASAAHAACKLEKVAELPVTMEGLKPVVQTKVNGQDARFIVDTGAFFSSISQEAAARFGLRKAMVPFGLMVKGVGGAQRAAQGVEADTFQIAGSTIKNQQFLTGGRIGGGDVAGLLGQNLLGAYDMEYDLANGVVRFFKATGCGGDNNLAYWSAGKDLSRIPLDNDAQYLAAVRSKAKINGQPIHVTFDTGAPISFLNKAAATRAGVKTSDEGVQADGITYGVYGRGQETFLVGFDSFAIGGEEIKHTRLRVANIELGESDMLLGADFFLSHRILVAKSQDQLYFTYNGGPVFRLDRNPGAQVRAQGSVPSDPLAAGGATGSAPQAASPAAAGDAVTAADYQRRGAASAARRDFAAAIADFSKAIELEPEAGSYYQARAMARLGARQPVLAMADLSEALKRQPNNVEALVTRGGLYLGAGDPKRAEADFDAALKLAPDNSSLTTRIGTAYASAGQFQSALRELDAWVAAHPRDERLGQVLGVRCLTRAFWGQQLDTALVDCDGALKRDKVSQVMEARGLVLLRMGRADEAITQFGAAIAAQPKSPQAYYGRGLAQLKKGDQAHGAADLGQAEVLAPGIARQFRRFGLTPEAMAGAAG